MKENRISRADLINEIYESSGLKRKDIIVFFNSLEKAIKNSFENNKEIEWRGLGVFELKKRKAYENARNPRTGEKVSVGERTHIVFKPGRELRKYLKNSEIENEKKGHSDKKREEK